MLFFFVCQSAVVSCCSDVRVRAVSAGVWTPPGRVVRGVCVAGARVPHPAAEGRRRQLQTFPGLRRPPVRTGSLPPHEAQPPHVLRIRRLRRGRSGVSVG